MKTLVAIARREILEKKFVLWASLVAATCPFIVPVSRGLVGAHAREVRDATAMVLGLGIAGGVAAAMGSSMFSGELSARRMSFFFSRPISSFALWMGKLAAAVVLIATPVLLLQGPAALLDRGLAVPVKGATVAAAAGGLVLILLLVNHFSTMIRSRSWLAFVDLTAAITIGAILGAIWTKLRRWSYEPPEALVWVVAFVVLGALLASSYRAVARGRTSLRETHNALSATLWLVLGATTAGLVGYSAWVLATPLQRLVAEHVSPAGPDGWVFAAGRPRGAQIGILYDTRSGRVERIPSDDITVSKDGRVAAWVERTDSFAGWTLFTRRLDSPARGVESKISFSNHPYPLVLSSDGGRVAAVESGLATISSVVTGKTLASVRIGQTAGWRTGWFVTPDRVRVLRHATGTGIESIEFDSASHSAPAVHSDAALEGFVMAISPAADRILLRETLRNRITLRDARTFEPVATLREGLPPGFVQARFLEDGSVVLALNEAAGVWLEVFSPTGARTARFRVGDSGRIRFGEQPAAEKIFLSFGGDTGAPSPSGMTSLLVADVRTGTVSRATVGLDPLWAGWFWLRTQIGRPGSESSRLFVDQRYNLVRFDPATGERKVLLPGS